jgi:hypothetical protein
MGGIRVFPSLPWRHYALFLHIHDDFIHLSDVFDWDIWAADKLLIHLPHDVWYHIPKHL